MEERRPELSVQEAWDELIAQLRDDIPEQEVVVTCLQALLFGANADEYPCVPPVPED